MANSRRPSLRSIGPSGARQIGDATFDMAELLRIKAQILAATTWPGSSHQLPDRGACRRKGAIRARAGTEVDNGPGAFAREGGQRDQARHTSLSYTAASRKDLKRRI